MYVTDGIANAMEQAKAAAGDRNVHVIGGYTAQRALEAGALEVANQSDPGVVGAWPTALQGVAVSRRVGNRLSD
jgi:hypothetical protein